MTDPDYTASQRAYDDNIATLHSQLTRKPQREFYAAVLAANKPVLSWDDILALPNPAWKDWQTRRNKNRLLALELIKLGLLKHVSAEERLQWRVTYDTETLVLKRDLRHAVEQEKWSDVKELADDLLWRRPSDRDEEATHLYSVVRKVREDAGS